jgi:DNA sulfur modification protein DndC
LADKNNQQKSLNLNFMPIAFNAFRLISSTVPINYFGDLEGQLSLEKKPMFDINIETNPGIALNSDSEPDVSSWEKIVNNLVDLIRQGYTLSSHSSFGKDSSCVTILTLRAIQIAEELKLNTSTHFVCSATTKIDNPAMDIHRNLAMDEVQAFVDLHKLPVKVIQTEPRLTKQFQVSTVGRGALPRFVENAAVTGRTCSIDLKVLPQQENINRIIKMTEEKLLKENTFSLQNSQSSSSKVVMCLGTRLSESKARAIKMSSRQDHQWVPVHKEKSLYTLSPIMDWDYSDVWSFIMEFTTEDRPFKTFSDGETFHRMHQLYKDANEGTCGVMLGEKTQKAACGSREGCFLCFITGQSDKSFENMIKEDRHSHLKGLNQLRNFIYKSRWDLSNRELVGRTLSNGYAPIRPDVYTLEFRQRLLSYMLTLDALEVERAEQVEADIATGKLERTPENLYFANTHFKLIDEEQIIAINLHWNLHHYAPHANLAIEIWHQVHSFGRRYAIPDIDEIPKKSIPEKRWYFVGDYDHEAPADGLRDYGAELWNPYLNPDRPSFLKLDGQPVVYHETEESFTVDKIKAVEFIDQCFDNMISIRQYSGLDGARFMLNECIIRIATGKISQYNRMALRGQYFSNLALRKNFTPAELDRYLTSNSISNKDFLEIQDKPMVNHCVNQVVPLYSTRNLF